MLSFIPWGLYRPYKPLRGTTRPPDMLADITIPLVFLLAVAIASAVPTFQVKGVLMAMLYVLVAFHILCFLRGWVMGWSAYPTENGLYISPSLRGHAELEGLFLPSVFWVGMSFGIAYLMWGWTLKN